MFNKVIVFFILLILPLVLIPSVQCKKDKKTMLFVLNANTNGQAVIKLGKKGNIFIMPKMENHKPEKKHHSDHEYGSYMNGHQYQHQYHDDHQQYGNSYSSNYYPYQMDYYK